MTILQLRKFPLLALFLSLVSCSSSDHSSREPASTRPNLTGTYLGEAFYMKRPLIGGGQRQPAMRLYLHPIKGKAGSYHAVLMEYDNVVQMAAPYLASQKAPGLNKVVGYLNRIAKRIYVYRVVPEANSLTYSMHEVSVVDGKIVPQAKVSAYLKLPEQPDPASVLAGAIISGMPDGNIFFPGKNVQPPADFLTGVKDKLTVSQYELTAMTYRKANLASSWRGNLEDLEGSYLSEYAKMTDGVLELYRQGSDRKAKFLKSTVTKSPNAQQSGEYYISEPLPDMFVLTPTRKDNTASDRFLSGRIGLFLDVFDASAPEAGGHEVTELVFISPTDPADFLMYYQHPDHKKNVGVE
jgi:hypothetical protein